MTREWHPSSGSLSVEKRQRAAALQDLSAVRPTHKKREASWSAAALCRFRTFALGTLFSCRCIGRRGSPRVGCYYWASPGRFLHPVTQFACFVFCIVRHVPIGAEIVEPIFLGQPIHPMFFRDFFTRQPLAEARAHRF